MAPFSLADGAAASKSQRNRLPSKTSSATGSSSFGGHRRKALLSRKEWRQQHQRRKVRSILEIDQDDSDSDDSSSSSSSISIPSRPRKKTTTATRKALHETIVLDNDNDNERQGKTNDDDDDESSLEVPYAMDLSQPATAATARSKKKKKKESKKRPRQYAATTSSTGNNMDTTDSHSSSKSSDDESSSSSDDSTSIGFESPPNSPQQQQGRRQHMYLTTATTKKETIRPGDVIDYQNTILAVAGSSQGRGRAVVLATRPHKTEYPLVLHNGAVLPACTPIQRVAEYRNGTLYPHHGQLKALHKFRMKERTLTNQTNGQDVTVASLLMQQAERLKRAHRAAEQEGMKILRGERNFKNTTDKEDPAKATTKKNKSSPSSSSILELSSDSSESALLSSPIMNGARKGGRNNNQDGHGDSMTKKSNGKRRKPLSKSPSCGSDDSDADVLPAAMAASKGNQHSKKIRRNETNRSRPPIPSFSSPPPSLSKSGTASPRRGCKEDTGQERNHHEATYRPRKCTKYVSAPDQRQSAGQSQKAIAVVRRGVERGPKEQHATYDTDEEVHSPLARSGAMQRKEKLGLLSSEKLADEGKEQVNDPWTPREKTLPSGKSLLRGKRNNDRIQDEFDTDSSSDDELEFGLAQPVYSRRDTSTSIRKATMKEATSHDLVGTSISIRQPHSSESERLKSHRDANLCTGKRGSESGSDSTGTCEDCTREVNCKVQTPPSSAQRESSGIFQLKKQNHTGLSSGNKNLVDSSLQDACSRDASPKPGRKAVNRAQVGRYQPLDIVDARIRGSPQNLEKAYKRMEKRRQLRRRKEQDDIPVASLKRDGKGDQRRPKTDRPSPQSSELNYVGAQREKANGKRRNYGNKRRSSQFGDSSRDSSASSSNDPIEAIRPYRQQTFSRNDDSSDEEFEWDEKQCHDEITTLCNAEKEATGISNKNTQSLPLPSNTKYSRERKKRLERQRMSRSLDGSRVDSDDFCVIDLTSSSKPHKPLFDEQESTKEDHFQNSKQRKSTSSERNAKQDSPARPGAARGVPNRFDLSSSSEDDEAPKQATPKTPWSSDCGVDDPPPSSAHYSRTRKKALALFSREHGKEIRSRNSTSSADIFDYKSSDENFNPQPLSGRKRVLSTDLRGRNKKRK